MLHTLVFALLCLPSAALRSAQPHLRPQPRFQRSRCAQVVQSGGGENSGVSGGALADFDCASPSTLPTSARLDATVGVSSERSVSLSLLGGEQLGASSGDDPFGEAGSVKELIVSLPAPESPLLRDGHAATAPVTELIVSLPAPETYLPSPAPAAESEAEEAGEAAATVPTLRGILMFALPTLAMMLSSPLLSLIDTSVVGLASSTSQLAALGPATKACDHLEYLCSALGVATTALGARTVAEGRPDGMRRVVGTSLTSAVALGLALAAALRLVAAPLMRLMMAGGAANGAAFGGAVQYTLIRAVGLPAALVAMVLQAGFIANKDANSSLLAVPFAAVANIVLDCALVGPLNLGAAGAAWGTVASQLDGVLPEPEAEEPVLRRQLRAPLRALGGVRRLLVLPKRAELASLAALVAPMSLALSARSAMSLSITASVACLGTVALAAHQVFECLYWLFCPFGDALGVCSQAYLPELLGTKERLARTLQSRVALASASLGVGIGALSLWVSRAAPHLFTRHAAVHAAMSAPAAWLGASMAAYIVSGALEGSLIARRCLRPLAASHVGNTAFALGALVCAVRRPGFSLAAVWRIVTAVNVMRCVEFSALLVVATRRAHSRYTNATGENVSDSESSAERDYSSGLLL
ncbi:hypothetical protein EMIHUDRAFT_222788 [Emiliania huxleyi CCMP1516]|uniref:Polysaccharide biosynthesis protein C-terminal domain-containing protein n=2 Tax=Emiliania huxleyi TaxID=2903 RepID=A0A0D3KX63_EMIH1|nr:hypothetical protein EMIHUDRAFT_222788 [Emiliania huxleyi CCMP1516]EOD40348.1 hypothetical protein EMIHUDRAFT_222788 [Emiliania huxleyi CCMP1516]|eukprot:XP_005792777.1 hypothetical protein EMIHUDRAFT_222788 [Emiliania huxleyi CCMP1516]